MGSIISQLFGTAFRFQNEIYLWLLILCPFLPWLLRWVEHRKGQMAESFFSKSFIEEVVWKRFKNYREKKRLLLVLSMASLLIALARPQWGAKEVDVPNSGLDIVFLLDLSRSMATEDVVPSRLKKAKHIIKNFLQRFASDRVAVVGFAGTSIPLVPMTTDYEYVEQVLEDADENYIVNQGTDYKAALESALQMIERGGENESLPNQSEQKNRVVILISDGESHVGAEREAYTVLKDAGVVGFSIGVGSFRGGPIPLRDTHGVLQGYKKDHKGSNVVSQLQEVALKEFAQQLGGNYFLSTADEGEVDMIYQQLTRSAKNSQNTNKVRQYNELYQFFILLSVLLLFYVLWLPDAQALLGLFIAFGILQAGLSLPALGATMSLPGYLKFKNLAAQLQKLDSSSAQQQKNALENQEKEKIDERKMESEKAELESIVGQIKALQVEYPDNVDVQNLLATALLKNKNFSEAAGQYELLRKTRTGEDQLKAQFNAAQAWKEAKDLARSQSEFQDLLERLKTNTKRTPFEEQLLQETKKAVQVAQNQSGKSNSQQEDQNENSKNGEENKPDQDKKEDKKNKNNSDGKSGSDKKDQDKNGDDKNSKEKEEKPDKSGKLQEKHQNQFKSQSLSENDAKGLLQHLREQDKGTQRKVKINKQSEKRGKDDETESNSAGQDW